MRTHFADLLRTNTVGTAQAVYDYKVADFDGDNTVIVVASGPIERKIGSLGNCWDITVTLDVYVFVLYADTDNGWTESDATNALDAIEALVADTVINNQTAAGYWDFASYSGPTQPDVVPIGGIPYQRELIRILMEKTQ